MIGNPQVPYQVEHETVVSAPSTGNQPIADDGESTSRTSDNSDSRETVLRVLAERGEPADYIAERRAQDMEDNGGELSPSAHESRADRMRKAATLLKEKLGETGIPPVHREQEQDQESHGNEREKMRREAEFSVTARQFFDKNPDAKEHIAAVLPIYPISDHVTELLLDSQRGAEVVYELAKLPEAIDELNALPPAAAARVIGLIEGRIIAEGYFNAENAPRMSKRGTTQAPEPLKHPKGGASAPKDPKSMSMPEYMAWRKRQENG